MRNGTGFQIGYAEWHRLPDVLFDCNSVLTNRLILRTAYKFAYYKRKKSYQLPTLKELGLMPNTARKERSMWDRSV